MGRSYIVEEAVEIYLGGLQTPPGSCVTGLLIGQSSPQRDFIVLAVQTPYRDSKGHPKVSTGSPLDEIDVEWVTEHAKQAGLTEDEKECLNLRSRSAGLTVSGCAHAVFVCQLIRLLRKKLVSENDTSKTHLSVGIIGGGHMGKQLAMVLMHIANIKPSDINISTKRPEILEDISKTGVECYYDNFRLAKWADVLFLCVLPSHLPQVCADLRCHLPLRCLVYSFISATPIKRLAILLDHSFIIKPRYEFAPCGDVTKMWYFHSEVTAALKDKEVLAASIPFSMSGGLSLDLSWVSAVLYSLLNMCTAEKLGSQKALQLLNDIFKTTISANTFSLQSFVNSSCASALLNSDDPFPWINLVDAQTKETPLSDLVSVNQSLQDCISVVFQNMFSNLEDGPKDALPGGNRN